MQTASSYLFPWGRAQYVLDGLDQINKDTDGTPLPERLKVRYSIFKYDETVSGAALEQSARDALGRMLRNMKEFVNDRVMQLFSEEEEDLGSKDPVITARAACKKAQDTLRDARALSLMFALSDRLEAGFLAYDACIERKRMDIQSYEDAVLMEEANTVQQEVEDGIQV
jgi:hypothetical protein